MALVLTIPDSDGDKYLLINGNIKIWIKRNKNSAYTSRIYIQAPEEVSIKRHFTDNDNEFIKKNRLE